MMKGQISNVVVVILVVLGLIVGFLLIRAVRPKYLTRLRFQFNAFIWVKVLKRSIYLEIPRNLRHYFPLNIDLQNRLKVIEEGSMAMRNKNETGDYLFNEVRMTWSALSLDRPILKDYESNTITTFVTNFETDGEIKARDLMDYINKTKFQDNKEIKIGLITNTSNKHLAKFYNPDRELPKNFTAEIVYSEWTLKENPRGTFECASKEMKYCYMPYTSYEDVKGRKERYEDVYHPYYSKGGSFQTFSERKNWEPDSLTDFIEDYLCEVSAVSDLMEKLERAFLWPTVKMANQIKELVGGETLDESIRKPWPCPYYKTECGYLNKSLACCEDKVFICIRGG